MIRDTKQIFGITHRQTKKAPVSGLRDAYSGRGRSSIRIGQKPHFFLMLFAFMIFIVVFIAVFIMMLFLMMYNRASWDIKVTELRVFIGSTDIKATEIVLVRDVMGVAIVDRLSFQTQCKL